jgi:hypothetical protein
LVILLFFILVVLLFLFLIKLKSWVQAQPKVTAASRRRWLSAVGVADGGETPPLPFAATPLREGNGFALRGGRSPSRSPDAAATRRI